MPTYKLYYFPLRGRGEIARLLFAASGQSYQNELVSFADWPAMKPKMPTGTMPVLEVDGRKISQSMTINRFLARQFGMAGKTNMEQAMGDQVIDTMVDFFTEYGKYHFEKDEKTKDELKTTLIRETFPKFANMLVSFLDNNEQNSGYFVGLTLTLADIVVYEGFVNMLAINPDILSTFPTLAAHRKLVEKNQRLKQYVDNRPKSNI